MPLDSEPLLTAFGVIAASVMVTSYALEDRHRYWIAVFALGCAATAVYGVLSGAWVFAVLETIWAGIAVRKFQQHPIGSSKEPT